jgi:ABC-type nitrate/sulfonate/bicarbonate transport system permease component
VLRWAPPVALLAAVVALWEALTAGLGVNPLILPGPALVATSTWGDRSDLVSAIGTTTVEALLGLVLAVAVAVPMAVAIDWFRTVRASLYPLLVASQTLPLIALAPLVVIWFGFGEGPKIVLVALFTFFPIVVGTVQGMAAADPDAIDLLRTLRASRWQLLTKVRFPSALPQLFTGLKISVTYAFSTAIVTEFVGGYQGLGVLMYSAAHDAPAATDLVFGATVVTALLTIVLFGVVAILQRVAMPWRPRDPT